MANKETVSVVLKLISDISDVSSNLKSVQNALGSLKVPDKLKTSFDKIFSDLERETGKISGLMSGGFKKAGDVTKLENSYKTINSLMYQLQVNMNKITDKDLTDSFQIDTKVIKDATDKIKALQKNIEDTVAAAGDGKSLEKVTAAVKQLQGIGKGGKSIGNFLEAFKTGDIAGAEAALKKLEQSFGKLKEGSKDAGTYKQVIDTLKQSLTELSDQGLQDLINQLNTAEKELKDLNATELQKLFKAFEEGKLSVAELAKTMGAYGAKIVESARHQSDLNGELDRMKGQIKNFFSLTNSVYLFQRAIRSAFDTVRELDGAMTEIAVVSDFTVGDMWEQLPTFTAQANELGSSIKDVYQATTLFVQQGLNLNDSLALSNETLKMARIAGMDAAAATDAMTAALRGFNMELDAASGQRINDVYSELAAITAADTQEISTAMTKTASIAHNAGMEFETTAAFLSQIIETTRESAETAGTAMKTVIARFQELKKDPSEIGEVEGEIVDANKIETALRTIGVALRDQEGQFRDLDDVFLEIAQKWNGLDTNTQRYIATMAAGSRQQSRFIAMMSDYDRTMELVGAANNSAGSSNEQFNKTLDSMEAKLNKLKNAWDQFTMGLANNEIIKIGIDLLTNLLTTVNGLIDGISGGNGLVKSVLSLTAAFGGIKLGGAIFNKGLESKTVGNIIEKFTGKPRDIEKQAKQSSLVAVKGFMDGFKAKGFKKTLGDVFESFEIPEDALDKMIPIEQLDFSNVTVDPNSLQNLKTSLKDQLKNISADKTEVTSKVQDMIDAGQFSEASTKAKELGVNLQLTGEQANQTGLQMKKATTNINAVGAAAAAAGGLFILLGEGINKLGFEEVGAGVKAFGAALIGIGAILPVLTTAMTAFGVSVNIALWPITLTIAAIAVLIGLFVGLSKVAYNVSLEGRMEAAAEATEKAKQAAEQTKQAYDDLLGDKTEYDELQNALSQLTKGTDEWKQKLIEANQQVLKLMETYPILAGYINRGSEGQLTIDTKGFDILLDQQQQAVKNAQANVVGSQVKEEGLKQESYLSQLEAEYYDQFITFREYTFMSIDELAEKLKEVPDMFEPLQKLTFEEFKNLDINKQKEIMSDYGFGEEAGYDYESALQQMEFTFDNRPIYEFSDAILEVSNGSAFGAEQLLGMETALVSYNDSMSQSLLIQKGMIEGMINANSDAETAQSEFFSNVSAGYANIKADDYNAELEKRTKELYSSNGKDEQAAIDKAKELQKQEGSIITDVSGGKEMYQQMYAQMMNITVDEIDEDIKNDKDKLAEAIAKMDLSETYTKGVSEIVSKLDIAANSGQKNLQTSAKRVAEIFGNESLGLGQGDIDAIIKSLVEDSVFDGSDISTLTDLQGQSEQDLTTAINNYLEPLGLSLETLNMTASEFINSLTLGEQAIEDAYSRLDSTFANNENMRSKLEELNNLVVSLGIDSGLTGNQLKAISTAMSQVAIQGGNAENFIDTLNKMMADVNPDKMEEVLNLLSTTDFSSKDSIKETLDMIEDLGVTLNDELTGELLLAANAVAKLDLQKLEDQLKSLGDVYKTVQGKAESGEATYSGEDVKALSQAGIDIGQFIRTGFDEYTYIGDTTNGLLAQIESYTSSILAEMSKEIDESVAKGEKMEAFFGENTTWTGMSHEGKWTNQQEALAIMNGAVTIGDQAGEGAQGYISRENANEIAKQMGVENIESFSNEQLAQAMKQIYEDFFLTLDTNRGIQEQYNKDEATLTAIGGRTSDEVRMAGESADIQKASIIKDATEAGLNINELNDYADHLQTITDLSENMATEIAKDNMAMNESIKELNSNWDTWEKGLKAPGTSDYSNALTGLRNNMKNMLGITDDLSEEFLTNEKNMNLMAQAAKGDASAINTLRGAAAKDIIANAKVELDENSLNEVNSLIDNFINEDLTVGMQLDDTQFGEALLNALVAAGATVNDINSAFESLGWEPELDYEEMTFDEAQTQYGTSLQQVYVPSAYDSVTGQPTDWKMQTLTGTNVSEIDGSQTVRVPVIRSKDGSTKPTTIQDAFKATYQGSPKNTINPSSKPSTGGGGGGGGSEEKKDNWKNPYDELYNLTEEVNEALRQREKLEREYDRMLERRTTTYQQIRTNQREQLESLKKEIEMQKQLQAGRLRQIREAGQETHTDEEGNEKTFEELGVTKYAQYDEKTGTIKIDWNAIDKVKDEELGAAIEEYISLLEERAEQYEETQETIEEMQDTIEEIQKQGMAEYLDFEQRIYDALVNEQQAIIDSYQNLSDTISETNSEILNSLQESIDLERQINENTKTEEDINEKEARLAYLRRDTSNANDMEIRQLEKELAESREAYGEQLVDQELARLNKQAEDAAAQREKQIALMQAQLDWQTTEGYFWPQVEQLLREGFSPNGTLDPASNLMKLLKEDEGWKGLSHFGKINFADEMAKAFLAAQHGYSNWQMYEAKEINKSLTLGNGTKLTYKNGKWYDKNNTEYTGVEYDAQKGEFVYKDTISAKPTTPTPPPTNNKKPLPTKGWGVTVAKGAKFINGQTMDEDVRAKGFDSKHKGGFYVYQVSGDDYLLGNGGRSAAPNWTGWVNKKYLTAYAKGGIADFTGPAWLDGTKSNPELILNAKDTENFIMLKDILSNLLKAGVPTGKSGGDNYFDIKIEVDELSNDYDVEQLTAKIKREITDDAQYRNVNAINFLR